MSNNWTMLYNYLTENKVPTFKDPLTRPKRTQPLFPSSPASFSRSYSDLILFTGLSFAARQFWKVTVRIVITVTIIKATI